MKKYCNTISITKEVSQVWPWYVTFDMAWLMLGICANAMFTKGKRMGGGGGGLCELCKLALRPAACHQSIEYESTGTQQNGDGVGEIAEGDC